MKKLLATLLLLFPLAVFAGTENMVAQCEAVMRCELCRVANDTNAYPNGIPLPVNDSKGKFLYVRRIPAVDYNYIRNAGDSKVDGRYLMCMRVEEVMKDPESARALAARSLFKQDWIKQEYCP